MNTLVIPFLIFSLLTFLLGAAFFFWAWRAGQFSRQDRARYLALWAEVPDIDKESTNNQAPNHK